MREKRVQSFGDLPLLDFVTTVSPRFTRPEHLVSVVPRLEAAFESPQFFSFSAPPRHGKSQLVFHFIAKFIAKYPHLNVAYCSYSATFAERKSVEIRELARRAGVEFDKASKARDSWRTAAGGSFLARGPGGPLTGEGVHLLVCDDPYRSRPEAESGTIRENVWDWWTSVPMTRLEPGASVVVTHTRWHMDDLIGRLTTDLGVPHFNLPAINEAGEALWPERYDVKALQERRKQVGEYDWASMYMGEPRPRGGAVFGDTHTYTDAQFAELKIVKYVIGIDCAYTKKTHADFSVAVVLAIDDAGNHYVVDVRRKQCESPAFASILKELRLAYPGAPIYWYTGGQEKEIANYFRNTQGVPVKDIPARDDKFVRAQSVAAAWNAGRVFVPSDHKPWLDAFISEVLCFTGLDDPHDDQVDALAAAYIPSAGKKVFRGNLHEPVLMY